MLPDGSLTLRRGSDPTVEKLSGMELLRLHCRHLRKGDFPFMFHRCYGLGRGDALRQAQAGPPAAAYPRPHQVTRGSSGYMPSAA
jgi:hypothetical protein